MTTHVHNGVTLDRPGVELDELSRSIYNTSPISDFKRTPSHISNYTGCSLFDDDEQSLIPRHGSMASKQILNEGSDGRGTPARSTRERRSRFSSWKVGVVTAASMTSIVLLVNTVLTVWASSRYGLEKGIGTAYEGSCDTVSAWSFWLHILINGLSSMLLGASNYTMQCITAPTRTECDRAHESGDWLDVGVPSIGNLFKIRWQRRFMWALLALSSTPIHLLYNSAVFKTLDDNRYQHLLAGSKFLGSNPTLPSGNTPNDPYNDYRDILRDTALKIHEAYRSDPASFKNLSSKSCIETYATYYLSGHGDVILIADDTDTEIVPDIPMMYEDDKPSDMDTIPFKWRV
jgi:hypothetical protein